MRTTILFDFFVVCWCLWPAVVVSVFLGSFSRRGATLKKIFSFLKNSRTGPGSHSEGQGQPPTQSLAYVHTARTQVQTLPKMTFIFMPELLPDHTLINEVSDTFFNTETRSCHFLHCPFGIGKGMSQASERDKLLETLKWPFMHVLVLFGFNPNSLIFCLQRQQLKVYWQSIEGPRIWRLIGKDARDEHSDALALPLPGSLGTLTQTRALQTPDHLDWKWIREKKATTKPTNKMKDEVIGIPPYGLLRTWTWISLCVLSIAHPGCCAGPITVSEGPLTLSKEGAELCASLDSFLGTQTLLSTAHLSANRKEGLS